MCCSRVCGLSQWCCCTRDQHISDDQSRVQQSFTQSCNSIDFTRTNNRTSTRQQPPEPTAWNPKKKAQRPGSLSGSAQDRWTSVFLHICGLMIGQHARSPAVLQYFIYNERVLNIYLMLNSECHRVRAGPVSEEPAEASQSDRDDLLVAELEPRGCTPLTNK